MDENNYSFTWSDKCSFWQEVLLKLKLSIVELLELTSLYKLLVILNTLFTTFIEQPTLMRRSIVLNLTLS